MTERISSRRERRSRERAVEAELVAQSRSAAMPTRRSLRASTSDSEAPRRSEVTSATTALFTGRRPVTVTRPTSAAPSASQMAQAGERLLRQAAQRAEEERRAAAQRQAAQRAEEERRAAAQRQAAQRAEEERRAAAQRQAAQRTEEERRAAAQQAVEQEEQQRAHAKRSAMRHAAGGETRAAVASSYEPVTERLDPVRPQGEGRRRSADSIVPRRSRPSFEQVISAPPKAEKLEQVLPTAGLLSDSLQAAVEAASKDLQPGAERSQLMRTGALGTLLAATVALPLSGILADAESATAASTPPRDPVARSLGEVDNSVLQEVVSEENEDAAIQEVPAAASRAQVREAFAQPQPGCISPETAGADGVRNVARQEAVLFWPMIHGTYEMTSPFGWRVHPVYGVPRLHEGVDYSAPLDTPMYAPADGVVKDITTDGYGTAMTISHNLNGEVFETVYRHLYPSTIYVAEGQEVQAGQHIAGVGNSGVSTGPHLHFEVVIDGTPVDPEAWLSAHEAVQVGSCGPVG
ncbi:M23 family metallopeptidase [Buchananella hordeovulneris]|uniref:M23 family metallopeptidase n=1 Tax=Buchananella hordeovulneris TaxID=52770 RepID=UPI001161338B|nr:M23 family metallopeptidase [Buchananella hordeovulneris]